VDYDEIVAVLEEGFVVSEGCGVKDVFLKGGCCEAGGGEEDRFWG
jgi:hypothetical protein